MVFLLGPGKPSTSRATMLHSAREHYPRCSLCDWGPLKLCSAPPVLLYPVVPSTSSYILRFFLCYLEFLPRAEARLRASAPSQGRRQDLNPRYTLFYLLASQMLTFLVDGGNEVKEQFSNC